MIQEHIHSLLFEHGCVIIPDFGGLITHYESARIHPVKHTFSPPAKRIAFNEKLKMNDGLLINTFSYNHGITPEEAKHQVADFVRQLNTELQASLRFELKGVGIFRLNTEQKIEFEYIPGDNFLNDSFGLPELLVRPVLATDAAAGLRTLLKEKQREEAVSTAKPSLRKRARRIYDLAAVFAITGLSSTALYFLSLQTDYSLSSLNPFSLYTDPAVKADPVKSAREKVYTTDIPAEEPQAAPDLVAEALAPEPSLDSTAVATVPEVKETKAPALPAEPVVATPAKVEKIVEVKKEALIKPMRKPLLKAPAKIKDKVKETGLAAQSNRATIEAGSNRYYIIAGGFSDLKNAEWCQRQMRAKGADSKVIMPFMGSPLHRVTVTDFETKEAALENLPALKKKFGNNIWILNY